MQIPQTELAELRREEPDRRIVLAVGAFDLFHAGHMDYLRWARLLSGVGGLVVVMVRTDERVAVQKGRRRPIIAEQERLYIVDNTKPVDITFLGTDHEPSLRTSMRAATALMPDVVAIGDGWSDQKPEWEGLGLDAEIVTAPFPHREGTTAIINRILTQKT